MAVDELLDEHEQGERVREWIRQNAFGIIGGIAVALALVYGYGKWQDHRQAERIAKGAAYAELDDSIAAGDLDKARALVASAGLDEGIYGALVALDLAGAQARDGDIDGAIATLRGVPETGPALAPVFARRLAVLLVEAGKPDEALAALGDATDAGSLAIRGDAEQAAGRTEQARDAYASALAALDPAATVQRMLLELKLIDAGGTPPEDNEDATP